MHCAIRTPRGRFSLWTAQLLTIASITHALLAQPSGYSFKALAFLGDAAPGSGGTFVNDFEPNAISNRGEVLFGADLTAGGEGIFTSTNGQTSLIARSFTSAPGGGTFDAFFFGPATLNDQGEVGFVFPLSPFGSPFGVNAGVYQFSQARRTTTPVIIPGVTPAPGGGVFAGSYFGPSLNNRGDLIFPGIVPTDQGIHLADEPYVGLGMGIFKAAKAISNVVGPGDPAPGGGKFDFTDQPWANDGGDIAFVGHIAGEECRAAGFLPQAVVIGCLGSVYVKDAATGQIQSVAHEKSPAPRGGVYRQAFAPVMNNRGDIVFLGDLTAPPDANQVTGVYLQSGGTMTAVARPGDAMPGGGKFVTASVIVGNQIHINNAGQVAFNAVIDTDVDGDGTLDTALFVWSGGSVRLVARTGTVIPGIGTIRQLVMGTIVVPPPPVLVPNSGAVNNDRGQVIFGATLTNGNGVLLVATTTP